MEQVSKSQASEDKPRKKSFPYSKRLPLAVLQKIRWALLMTDRQPFLRCQARDRTKMRAFEAKGDFSHSGLGHVCKECRCSRVAGQGTKGDFYGIGVDTGHFGVGWCRWHEDSKSRRGKGTLYARHCMEALQAVGRAKTDDMGEFIDVVRDEAAIASSVKQARDASDLVMHHLEEFKKLCEDKDLTESHKGNIVPASDKTRIELACKVASTIASIAKTEFDLNAKRMVAIDDVIMRVKMMIDLSRRFIPDPREQAKYFEEFKDVWKSVVDKRGG